MKDKDWMKEGETEREREHERKSSWLCRYTVLLYTLALATLYALILNVNL